MGFGKLPPTRYSFSAAALFLIQYSISSFLRSNDSDPSPSGNANMVPFSMSPFLALRRRLQTLGYTGATTPQLASPVTFLLWCLGTARRRRGGNNLLQPGRNPHQRQRRGWREVIGVTRARIGSGDCTAREFPEHEEAAGSAIIRLAALGEGGRLAAFEKLRELQREGACCDVTLSVGESHFKAHK